MTFIHSFIGRVSFNKVLLKHKEWVLIVCWVSAATSADCSFALRTSVCGVTSTSQRFYLSCLVQLSFANTAATSHGPPWWRHWFLIGLCSSNSSLVILLTSNRTSGTTVNWEVGGHRLNLLRPHSYFTRAVKQQQSFGPAYVDVFLSGGARWGNLGWAWGLVDLSETCPDEAMRNARSSVDRDTRWDLLACMKRFLGL